MTTLALDDRLLEGLNPRQAEAVLYRGPSLLIVAGAGSGKTSVLTRRIAGLIDSGEATPLQILAITFTNKAAAEMRERVTALLGRNAEGMLISTFHSACVRILRRQAEVMGMKQGFTIYDTADSRALLKRIIRELDADTLNLTPAIVAGKISKLKNELTDVETYARNLNAGDPAELVFLEIFRRYTAGLRRANAMDFDDLIAETVYLFRAFPDVAALYQRRFRHVLVDEYQDTNHAQYALIRELTRPIRPENASAVWETPISGRRPADADRRLGDREDTRMSTDASGGLPGASLTVVGDSDQSIYAFRGADIRNIVEFERDFPDSKVVLLEQNYRSTQNILDAANAVIANNFDRVAKNLFTTVGSGDPIIGYTGYSGHDEAQFVADEIEALRSAGRITYDDVAVFVRVNSQTRPLEEIFIRSGIPYRIPGGTKFFERAEIKDAMAYLVQIANPDDDLALRRILNVPKRGIGPATEAALQAHADRMGIPLRGGLGDAGQLGLGPKVTNAILDLAAALDETTTIAETARPADVLVAVIQKTGLVTALRATGDAQDEARAENIEELVNQAREYSVGTPEGTLVDFLTNIALYAAADEIDDSDGSVSIMTLHTAKGLEYDTVFLTGIEEDLLPHRISANEPGGLAEERRLFYVGITRAKKRLFLSLAMTRSSFGDTSVAMPSRYLQEIPAGLIDWRQSPGDATSRGGTRPRALNARENRGIRRYEHANPLPPAPPRVKTEWTSPVTGKVRDNGDLTLEVGERIRHSDFGEGKVTGVTGQGSKSIAEVQFDTAGRKRLLIKIAPIEKL